MAIDPSVLVVALSPTMTAAVLAWIVQQQRRNGHNGTKNGKNGYACPRNPENDPYNTRLGDVPVAWWQEQQKVFVEEFQGMRKAVEEHMRQHH